MKTMKKLVAALLVLTMVLALTGTAFAECLKAGQFVKFTKNSYAYKETSHGMKKITDPEVIVRKKSIALVRAVKGSYAFVQLTLGYRDNPKLGNFTYESDGETYWAWGYWFKTSTLKASKPSDRVMSGLDVTFANGGNGKSKPWYDDGKLWVFNDAGTLWKDDLDKAVKKEQKKYPYEDLRWLYLYVLDEVKDVRVSKDCMKHVEAARKVWMHKTPSLSNSYGKALRTGEKVKYRRVWAFDTRFDMFYGIRYKGKCLWVAQAYCNLVK